MNFIATVNAPAHGNIAVTFSDIEKRVLGAWRHNETVELSENVTARSEEHTSELQSLR